MRHLNKQHRHTGTALPWQRWTLNAGAAAGTVCLLFLALTLVFGLKPLIFASGSMSPVIPTGSLALAVPMPAAQAQPGQVVSVVNTDGLRITHRVVSASDGGGLILKGDANAAADPQPYAVESVERVVFSIPVLGHVVDWFSQPWLFFVAGLLCAYLAYVAFVRKPPRHEAQKPHKPRRRGRRRRSRDRRGWLGLGALATSVAMVVPLAILPDVESTWAAFQGQAVAGTAVAAVTPLRLTGAACGNVNSSTIEFTWTAPAAPPADYLVTVVETNAGGNSQPGAVTAAATLSGTSTSYATSNAPNSSGLLSSLLGALLGYTKYYTFSIAPRYGSWQAQPVVFMRVRAVGPLLGLGAYTVTCPASPEA